MERATWLSRRILDDLDTKHTDLICLFLCFITALCDSSAYSVWSCYLGLQTGNTITLGLGASGQPKSKPFGWLKSLVSISSFMAGSFTFANGMRLFGPRRPVTLSLSFLVQASLIIIASAFVEADLIPHTAAATSLAGGPLFLELIPIALLAFQSAGCLAASRFLGFSEIPIVVLTSVYFDIASDPHLLRSPLKNAERNRRVCGAVLYVVGAVCGGWLSLSAGGMQAALWIAAALKFCVAGVWLFWRQRRG
ncbi:YoaK family protein [Aspergillus aculeatinus CBS 121060]|uniref:DUF1275 domain protein n=1 Tax=Aspergillus aculeatinus CBS 121060 TaxID=1448322 RepID=A0ACD1HK81_9EURO|nr:DUF1275 domain protein [Aspergillus aculeatinus CBS 121060]RAH73825.1 DUF1275 domain protein [Aspergillus aculeatinus CBS 121060]